MAETTGPHASSDGELIRGVADGSEESFRFLYRRWAPRLGRFLHRATGCRETAEDLLQETFIRILGGAPRFEPRGSAAAWIYRIGANLVYSHWRRERSAPRGDLDPAAHRAEPAAPATQSPEEVRRRHAFEREVAEALERCPANHRLVFLLKVDQRLTYEEIAGILRCPVGTVKSRFHFAVRRLRRELRQWDDSGSRKERPSP